MSDFPPSDQPPRRALLLLTDKARRDPNLPGFVDQLESGGLSLLIKDTPARARIAEMIVGLRKEIDCVILTGSDATMSAGAIALRDTGLPLGILPLGISQDLIAGLGLSPDLATAARAILEGRTRMHDVGSVNGLPFFTVATVGMTVTDSRRLAQARASRFGRIAFPLRAAKALTRFSRFGCLVRCGHDVKQVRAMQITVGIGHTWRGSMPGETTPRAEGRQMLEVWSLEPPSTFGFLRMAHAFTENPECVNPDEPEFRTAQGPVIELVTRLPHAIVADGETISVTPARFSLLSEAVAIYSV